MEKKLTVVEAAKLLGVSKEAIYNRLRRGTLQSVSEEGVKYILLTKNGHKEGSGLSSRKAENGVDSAYVGLLKSQLEEMKIKNERLEADKERLIADKERLLIESKEKIEAIYKERDEQLKAILSLANRQIVFSPQDESTVTTEPVIEKNEESHKLNEHFFEEAYVVEEDEHEENTLDAYSDWRDLRSYLKEKGFSKKEKQHINETLGKKIGQMNDVMDKNGKLFIKKGKKLKEILGE